MAHEAMPHHHHDILKAQKENCHKHDHNKTGDNSCKILNHISISNTISYNFKTIPFAIIDVNFADLSYVINLNFNSQLLKVFDQIPILLKSQYNNSSFSLRAPPLV